MGVGGQKKTKNVLKFILRIMCFIQVLACFSEFELGEKRQNSKYRSRDLLEVNQGITFHQSEFPCVI